MVEPVDTQRMIGEVLHALVLKHGAVLLAARPARTEEGEQQVVLNIFTVASFPEDLVLQGPAEMGWTEEELSGLWERVYGKKTPDSC